MEKYVKNKSTTYMTLPIFFCAKRVKDAFESAGVKRAFAKGNMSIHDALSVLTHYLYSRIICTHALSVLTHYLYSLGNIVPRFSAQVLRECIHRIIHSSYY